MSADTDPREGTETDSSLQGIDASQLIELLQVLSVSNEATPVTGPPCKVPTFDGKGDVKLFV